MQEPGTGMRINYSCNVDVADFCMFPISDQFNSNSKIQSGELTNNWIQAEFDDACDNYYDQWSNWTAGYIDTRNVNDRNANDNY